MMKARFVWSTPERFFEQRNEAAALGRGYAAVYCLGYKPCPSYFHERTPASPLSIAHRLPSTVYRLPSTEVYAPFSRSEKQCMLKYVLASDFVLTLTECPFPSVCVTADDQRRWKASPQGRRRRPCGEAWPAAAARGRRRRRRRETERLGGGQMRGR